MIREFLEFYRMDYTLSTFLPECSLSQEPKTRKEIEDEVGLDPTDTSMPLLMHLILSFIKGVTTNLPEDQRNRFSKPAEEAAENVDKNPPRPDAQVLDVEEEVKSKPQEPSPSAESPAKAPDFDWNEKPKPDDQKLEPLSTEQE